VNLPVGKQRAGQAVVAPNANEHVGRGDDLVVFFVVVVVVVVVPIVVIGGGGGVFGRSAACATQKQHGSQGPMWRWLQ